ncbi:protein timeless isoform X1 [Schistocerca gregaria]|uniref:protein timeless isoform X1 n=1 Tax=Schistocerca gregaria TaxID=7010 RepID=UPI00211DF4B4|nr:protein timeless isoform X1 [Schistocerca gregaria]XP_049850239.1 protein timeless isoform X1 [Schistocerca gregaria]XP_049850240.1 protein timeless isoform X1 [Schistocerca gregaria]
MDVMFHLEIQNIFASLGGNVGDVYQINENCLSALGEILNKFSTDIQSDRNFRRYLWLSHAIKKEFIPLLINAKDDIRITDGIIRVFVNATTPIECLFAVDSVSKTDAGRLTISEVNQLLLSGKEAFVDSRSTRAVIDFMKILLEKKEKLSESECESINNCLLLLRNILHIPETRINQSSTNHTSMQNQILWNIFAQNVDKILIHLLTCEQKAHWGVTMVQLIALIYKDQHVGTLQNLLNLWFEASLSESSEDNESNTSPPDQGAEDSSTMVTSDPTSDSSDNGGNNYEKSLTNHCGTGEMKQNTNEQHPSKQHSYRKTSHCEANKANRKNAVEIQRKPQTPMRPNRKTSVGKTFNKKKHRSDSEEVTPSHTTATEQKSGALHTQHSPNSWSMDTSNNLRKDCPSASELSDYGYGTQVENQGSVSTSSNDDDSPQFKRPVHQKLHSMQKLWYNSKPAQLMKVDQKEWRRKKLVKRSKTNIMNMKALLHHTPTDEDISNLLKEFTVDFLLKGYGCLVQELFIQLLSPKQCIQVDTSHFFWLITYFLKFAAQLELELEHVNVVLSSRIVSYLTYEGVNLCEELEICFPQESADVKPSIRRLHLVVTAIREFIQALETYKKISHLSPEDRDYLLQLQLEIAMTEELKYLFLLLLRSYNQKFQTKQYLQDVIVSNHILMLFLDCTSKLPQYKGNASMTEHIKQFATTEIMYQYGILLEDFQSNGEFVNNCVFTMMHHVAGDLEKATVLFQPHILKSFSQIWETDFEVSDVWSDLIEYVIHKFVNVPKQTPVALHLPSEQNVQMKDSESIKSDKDTGWSKDEKDNLYWYYVQSARSSDPFGKMKAMYNENGSINKTKIGIIRQLLTQDIITQKQFDDFMKAEHEVTTELKQTAHNNAELVTSKADNSSRTIWEKEEATGLDFRLTADVDDRVTSLKDHLLKENKGNGLKWLQKVLIDICHVKLATENHQMDNENVILEPVAYFCSLKKQSIPVVPWTSEQKSLMLYQPFVQLLHTLGFHLPLDSGKIFARVPEFWTADVVFSIAQKLGPIDKSVLKFDEMLLKNSECQMEDSEIMPPMPMMMLENNFTLPNIYQSSSAIRSVPHPASFNDWMQLTMNSKTAVLPQRPSSPTEPSFLSGVQHADIDKGPPTVSNEKFHEDCDSNDELRVCSLSEMEAESVASELTRMCVSDEEDKQGIEVPFPSSSTAGLS